jgi:hypothetical protein
MPHYRVYVPDKHGRLEVVLDLDYADGISAQERG